MGTDRYSEHLPPPSGAQGGPRRRLLAAYRAILRRAAEIGWHDALNEYAREAEARGLAPDEVADEIEVFEEIDLAERLKGVDPILAEKRRDLHLIAAGPIAMIGGVIVTGWAADSGLSALVSVGAGVLAALVIHQLGAALTFLLVRH